MKTNTYTAEQYHSERTGKKSWCVRCGPTLLAVTMYRKGAETIAQELNRLAGNPQRSITHESRNETHRSKANHHRKSGVPALAGTRTHRSPGSQHHHSPGE